MERSIIRGFAAGILLATIVFAIYYYLIEEYKNKPVLTITELQEASNKQGYELIKAADQKQEQTSSVSKQKESAAAATDTKPQKEPVSEAGSTAYKLTIQSGTSSEDIGKELTAEGIIKGADSLAAYLNDNGLTTKIQIGEFILTKEMSIVQIASTITK